MNPKSLKRARGRVLARLAGLDRTSHDFGQISGGSNACAALPASHKRLCNPSSKPFFPIVADHLRELALIGAGQEVRGGLAAGRVHAHVQRRIEAETEAARRVVQLRRADAQVEQHALQLRDAERRELLAHRGKAGMHQSQPRIDECRARGDGLRVLVEGDQPAARRQPGEDRARMPAAAEGAVHVHPVVRMQQRIHGFVQKNGGVRPWVCAGAHRRTLRAARCGIRTWQRPGVLIGLPFALRAAGFALGSGPACSSDYPAHCVLRDSHLGAARRAHRFRPSTSSVMPAATTLASTAS